MPYVLTPPSRACICNLPATKEDHLHVCPGKGKEDVAALSSLWLDADAANQQFAIEQCSISHDVMRTSHIHLHPMLRSFNDCRSQRSRSCGTSHLPLHSSGDSGSIVFVLSWKTQFRQRMDAAYVYMQSAHTRAAPIVWTRGVVMEAWHALNRRGSAAKTDRNPLSSEPRNLQKVMCRNARLANRVDKLKEVV